jgi:hypothetical protein
MPRPVMAAALFFTGSLMLAAGIQIVASRPITLRTTLTFGFSILAALTVPVFSDFYRQLPGWTQQFTGSIISMAVVVAVPLNALFLLGGWHHSRLRLGADSKTATPASFNAFFDKQAKEWKVPAEDVARVRSVVDAAIEDVAANAHGPVEIQLGSDEFDILVALRYAGNLPRLQDARPKKEMVEEQSFVSGLAGISPACTPTASSVAPGERNARSSFSSGCDAHPARQRQIAGAVRRHGGLSDQRLGSHALRNDLTMFRVASQASFRYSGL